MWRSQIPPAPPGSGRTRRPRRVEVFAVETDTIQLSWGRLGPGRVTVAVDGVTHQVETDGGPGGCNIGALRSDAEVRVRIDGEGVGRPLALAATTLAAPPGDELYRFATFSDLHIGQESFGYFDTIRERPEPAEHHPERCARAAIDDAVRWGAQSFVLKGDLVTASHPDTWAALAELFHDVDRPALLFPGNHEKSDKSTVDAFEEAARCGLDLAVGVRATDLPGLRLVTADTASRGTDVGQLDLAPEIVAAAASSSQRGVMVALHHHLQRFRFPTFRPPGIPGPAATAFLDELARVQPRAIVTSGHTHRHRRRDHRGVVVTEVGCPKDYPGTWTGYVVHEGGIRQVVRRVTEPSCIRWTEWTRRAALGAWGHWSPGTLADRCFTHHWTG